MNQQAKPAKKKHPILGLFIVVGIVVIVIVIATSGGSGKSAHFRADVESISAPTPKTILVYVHVTNTGNAAGKPSCTISAQSPTGANGVTSFTATHTLAPKTEAVYRVYLRITTTRATRITKTEVKLSC